MTTTARFLVLWYTPEDPDLFERHYREVHVPLVKRLPGVRRYTFSRNTVPVRGDRYYRVAQAAASDVDTLSSTTGAGVRSMIYELEDL
jgi:uncharacterized protein (TIGR02118 family)